MIKGLVLVVAAAISSVSVAAEEKRASKDADDVLLSVHGLEITTRDFDYYVRDRIDKGTNPKAFERREGIIQALENLMVVKLLGAKARNQGVEIEGFWQWQLDIERERILYQALVEKLMAEQDAAADWNAVAKEEYIANPERFETKGEVRASHILVATRERSDEEARQIAEDLLAKVKAGEDFAELAETHSEDPSAKENRGDLGYFPRGRMAKPFEEQAFSLAPGEVSDLVKTRFGFHIIKVHDVIEPGIKPLHLVEDALIADVKARAEKALKERLLVEARSNREYKLDEEKLQAIENRYLD